MADQNEKAVTFKGAIKSKNYIMIKSKDYGIKTEKLVVPVRETFITRQKKSIKFKGTIKPKYNIKIKNQDYGAKPEKRVVPVRKTYMTRQRNARLIRRSASNLGQVVLSTTIKATENNENKESTENINLTIPKIYHNKHNDRFITKKVNKNNQRKKQTRSKKQCEKDNAVKKSRDSHRSKVIDRKPEDSISIKKSSQMVKAKNTKVIKRQQASRRVKKSVSKKAGVKLTAGTIKGIKSKAVLLSIGSAVGATKAIASFVALKFLAPIGILGITLIIIVSILVAIVGVVASVDPYIPITEEVLVTEIHVHLTELDVDWNQANGTSIRTDSKDMIALVFMGGGVDPERENNDAILAEVAEFHQAFHESGAIDMVEFLATHPVLSVVASDFPEFRELAFIHFYGTLGDPYEKDWRDAVTSHFGWRPDPFGSGEKEMHNGIDIAWDGIGGTPVLATISGTVQVAGYNEGGYGNWVMIVNDDDPDNRKETRYAHLHTISVSVGQNIEVGDVVGITGTTGSSTGDHLHHEFRRNGHLLNPYFYFPNEVVLEIEEDGDE